MSQPKLITDVNSNAIQAVELSDDAVAISVGLSSSSVALPANAMLVRIGLDVDSYIRFGTSGITVGTTNGHYFPKGVEVLIVPELATHMAVIAADTSPGNGTVASVANTQYVN